MPEAVLLELVVANLADELGPHRVPVELLPFDQRLWPPGMRASLILPGACIFEHLELAADSRREADVADEIDLPVLAVQAEEQRRDPAFGLLAPAEADDHAVGRLVLLDLDHTLARAREVGEPLRLRDHAVEPGRFEPVEPALRVLLVGRVRGDGEALGLALELLATLLERELVERLALPEQDVEGHEPGGYLRGQFARGSRQGGAASASRRTRACPSAR